MTTTKTPAKKTTKKTATTSAPAPQPTRAELERVTVGEPVKSETSRAQTIRMIPLDELADSPFQSRTEYTGIDELAASIAEKGVLQPGLARPRPNGKGYELVFGHRRKRGALKAKVAAMPCIVRELTDEQVIEAQVIENVQRVDVSALEEADGYRQLIERCKVDVDDIAARTGKSRATVYARLELLKLGKRARAAIESGKLSASVGLLLARVAEPTLQDKAVAELLEGRHLAVNDPHDSAGYRASEPLSFREAERLIRGSYLTNLSTARWKLDDADLVKKAGACSTCPKRSGARPVLFDDGKAHDWCLDLACFRAKVQAIAKRTLDEHRDKGGKVVEVRHRHELDRKGLVALDDRDYRDPKNRTFGAVLGKDKPDVVLAVTKDGDVVQAVNRDAADAVIRKRAPKSRAAANPSRADQRYRAEERKRRKRAAGNHAAALLVACRLTTKLGLMEVELARAWSAHRVRTSPHDIVKRVAVALGLVKSDEKDPRKAIVAAVEKLTAPKALTVALAIDLDENFGGSWSDRAGEFGTAALKLVKLSPKKARALGLKAAAKAKAALDERAAAAAKKGAVTP